ncbi:alpha/beta fold hydrolase [Mycolicibacterium sarraceniae]|uniref:Thioesterase n=1 Tax=Mycolicibacterium sarraceniae TaxID=1534348 RepID=A0A7I7SSH7_9MYCO|nr:alpha/beta fold hydrolase [Mycolicibacterium sarraceniae]BBY59952.1 thioesterase [Mycolicibacterium sarraceniae]
MTDAPTRRVVPVAGIPMSGLFAEAPNPRAVIVALHGGASSAVYFDCPGHPDLSLVRAAAAAGFSAVALDRPGYGASAPYSDAMWDPQRRVELAYGAADAMLGKCERGAGLFVLAHSNGCELALRMAVAERGRDLLGLELAGTGLRQYPAARAILKQATPTHRPAGIRELIWAPEELYPADVVNAVGSAGAPPQEAEISTHWAGRDFPALAGHVVAPVRFTAAEHEKVWDSTPEATADIAALFAKSRHVEIHHQNGAGHNLSLGVAAAQYHSGVFAFVNHCITADVDLEAG